MSDDYGAESGYALHVSYCEHAEGAIRLGGGQQVRRGDDGDEKEAAPAAAEAARLRKARLEAACEGCGEAECWVCLHCGAVLCGRFASGCMRRHAEDADHAVLALGQRDLSFWCFGCDNYVDHLSVRPVYDAYSVWHLAKFDEPPPVPFEG